MPAWLIAILPMAMLVLAAGMLLALGRSERSARWIGAIGLCAIVLAMLLLGWQTIAGLNTPELPDHTSIGPIKLSLDAFWLAIQWLSLLLGLLLGAVAYGTAGNSAEATTFARLLLSLAGTMLACVADDLIVLFVALELSTHPLTLPLARSPIPSELPTKRDRSVAVSLLSSALLLYGFGALYGLSGATDLTDIRDGLAAAASGAGDFATGATPLGYVAMVLIFAGLGVRLGVVPFHFGRAEMLAARAMTTFSTLLILSRLAAFVALLRVPCAVFVGYEALGQWLVWVLAAASMVIGSVRSLAESNPLRKLAAFTLASSGVVLVGISVGFWEASHAQYGLAAGPSLPGAWTASLVCFACHLAAVAGLCAVLSYLQKPDQPVEHIDELMGIARSQPLAALCALVFLFSLAGIPPLPVFWGNLLVLASAASIPGEFSGELIPAPAPGFVLLGLIAVLCVFATGTACVRMVSTMFLEPQIARPRPAGRKSALGAAVIVATITLGAGLLPLPLIGALGRLKVATGADRRATHRQLEMETTGIEPATSAVQGRRSPN